MILLWGNNEHVIAQTPPTITSGAAANNAENSVLAFALTANQVVTWSLVGGADQARFEISGSTLRWLANGTKDFEAPNDADVNNIYICTVRATNVAGRTADKVVTITVTDVVETVEIIQNGGFADASNWTLNDAGIAIVGGTLNFSIVSNGHTAINTSAPPHVEAGASYSCTFTMSNRTQGIARIVVGGTFGTSRLANGTYTETLVATDNSEPRIQNTNTASYSIDDVSVLKL